VKYTTASPTKVNRTLSFSSSGNGSGVTRVSRKVKSSSRIRLHCSGQEFRPTICHDIEMLCRFGDDLLPLVLTNPAKLAGGF
jgi:hypothetical protein